MHLSIIVPAFNEAQRIGAPLMATYKALLDKHISHEIIVVNDGSTDTTADVINTLKTDIPTLIFIDNKNNAGKGTALRDGVAQSTGTHILTIDADGSTPFEEFFTLYETMTHGPYDIVIGGRHSPASQILVKQPWYRILISRSANVIIQLTLLPGIQDTQCGFKLFKGDVGRELFQQSHTNGFGIDMEILTLAKMRSYPIKEVPVTWLNSPDSRVRPVKSTLKTLRELCTILWRYRLSPSKG